MAIETTAIGRYYKVYVNGEYLSQHIAEREAIESSSEALDEDPDADVFYIHEYVVQVKTNAGATTAGTQGATDTAPEITSTPAPSFTVGTSDSYDMKQHYTDDAKSTVTHSLTNTLPNGLTFSASTGVLDYDGVGAASTSSHTLVVTDSVGSDESLSFDIDIQSGGSLDIGTVTQEAETLEQIAIRAPVTGSVPQATTADVRYKLTSSSTWIDGHPLYRIQPSSTNVPAIGTVSDEFAWTIIGLEQGETYDVEITFDDGTTTDVRDHQFTTRSLPGSSGSATVTVSNIANLQTEIDNASPGDVIEISDGTYTLSTRIDIQKDGTVANPIVIRGESRDGVVIQKSSGGGFRFTPGDSSNIILENFTFEGSGVDSGVSTSSYFLDTFSSSTTTNITVRQITCTGVDRFIDVFANANGWNVYNNEITGNNLWQVTPTNYLESNITWNDAGIKLPGDANCAFNNTITAFGDTFSVASHSGSSVVGTGSNIHFYRNDIYNSIDDPFEVDYGQRNITIYDNRITNGAVFTSLDPLYGGPLIFARNVIINPYRNTLHKWNSTNSGHFIYNNTSVATNGSVDIAGESGASAWLQFNNGAQQYFGYRNNLVIYNGDGDRAIWLENTGYDNLDWVKNGWNHDPGQLVFDDSNYTTIANLVANTPSSTPIFSSATTQVEGDFVVEDDPFSTSVVLGTNSRTEITTEYIPELSSTSVAKNAGDAINNITDGYSGAAPDIGAIIEGRAVPSYGDTTTTAPAYIQELSDYQVRNLSGSYAPSNGTSDIESITPSEWLTNDPGGGLGGIITAWSGGFKAERGTKLYVYGGGHNDSANNGVYVFDYSGNTQPTGWTLPSISAVADVVSASNVYADGRGTSVHNYDGTVYADHNETLYRFNGAHYNPSGGFQSGAVKYDINADTWTEVASYPGTVNTVGCIYDRVSEKILVGMGGQFQAAFFDTSDDTFSAIKSTGAFFGGNVCGAYDSSRSRGVLVGNGENRLVTLDWSAETVTLSTLSASGSTSILSDDGISCFYDDVRDSYWIFGGPTGSNGWSNLYEMDASSFNITSTSLTGDTITQISGMIGSFGRFVFLSDWRAIGIIADIDTPASVIKLPS